MEPLLHFERSEYVMKTGNLWTKDTSNCVHPQ